jgi:DNA-binding MarR family transcriptional regulator
MASIHWLTLHHQEVTQIVLSSHTKIDPMTTSTVLRTLQTKGFVTRREHDTDTRAKTVILTEAGKKIVKKAIVAVEKFDRKFFSILGNRTHKFNHHLIHLLKREQ